MATVYGTRGSLGNAEIAQRNALARALMGSSGGAAYGYDPSQLFGGIDDPAMGSSGGTGPNPALATSGAGLNSPGISTSISGPGGTTSTSGPFTRGTQPVSTPPVYTPPPSVGQVPLPPERPSDLGGNDTGPFVGPLPPSNPEGAVPANISGGFENFPNPNTPTPIQGSPLENFQPTIGADPYGQPGTQERINEPYRQLQDPSDPSNQIYNNEPYLNERFPADIPTTHSTDTLSQSDRDIPTDAGQPFFGGEAVPFQGAPTTFSPGNTTGFSDPDIASKLGTRGSQGFQPFQPGPDFEHSGPGADGTDENDPSGLFQKTYKFRGGR